MPHVKVIIDAIRRPGLEKFKNRATLILKEKGEERYLPILVSSAQGDILAAELQGLPTERRTVPDPGLFLKSVNAVGSDIICVTVHFTKDTFYAKVLIYQEEEPRDVKCPIGIAMALACRTQVPILVNTEIMNKWALTMKDELNPVVENSLQRTVDGLNLIAREVLHF